MIWLIASTLARITWFAISSAFRMRSTESSPLPPALLSRIRYTMVLAYYKYKEKNMLNDSKEFDEDMVLRQHRVYCGDRSRRQCVSFVLDSHRRDRIVVLHLMRLRRIFRLFC